MNAQLKEVEFEQQALSWPQKAKAITIVNQESYNLAAGLLINIADLEREIIAHHKPIKDAAFAAHKAAVAAEKKLLDPLTEAKGIIKRGIGVWEMEQERIRQEEQRKAAEEARKREEEARIALAIEAEKQGATEETVEEIIQTPIPMVAPVVAPTFKRAAGVSARQAWKWRLVDENKVPREYLIIDEKKINSIVRAMGAKANIPGIEVYPEIITAVRR